MNPTPREIIFFHNHLEELQIVREVVFNLYNGEFFVVWNKYDEEAGKWRLVDGKKVLYNWKHKIYTKKILIEKCLKNLNNKD